MMFCLFKVGIIINYHSHWVLMSEDSRTMDPPRSNDDADVLFDSPRPSVVNGVLFDHILLVDLLQNIQITQIDTAEIYR